MEYTRLPLLMAWESFYVIVGTAAATLIGLQFVATVLSAQIHRGAEETNQAFSTPTIVHFSTALLVAMVINAPWPDLTGIAIILGLCGIVGLAYAASIIRTTLRQTAYKPVLEDWICHCTLPPCAYAALLLMAFLLPHHAVTALFGVSGAVLLLLFVGIHNAWDAVIFIAQYLQHASQESEDA